MDYGALLRRTWNIIWEHKFLILLGVLVALGGSGTGGSGTNVSFDREGIRPPEEFEFRPPEGFLRDFRLSNLTVGLIVLLVGVAVVIGLALWIVSTVARGALIAGADAIDAHGTSSFAAAWSAGWRRGWTLLGIGVLPAVPGFLLLILGLGSFLTATSLFGPGDMSRMPWGVAPLTALGGLACLLVPLVLVLGLLRTFANRACMLEGLGVFAAYRRGLEVLLDNLGFALLLFLIQVAISIGVGLLFAFPGLVVSLCCVLWPLLWLFNGLIAAYFSTLWTLAWREWTGLTQRSVL
ncbi:MAG: DUF7544 domain-containing protein [Anaerolineae bacterium]